MPEKWDRPEGRKGIKNMYINDEMHIKGFKCAVADIKEMGIEWAKHTFALRLKCTGASPSFTVGYGKAILYQEMRNKANPPA